MMFFNDRRKKKAKPSSFESTSMMSAGGGIEELRRNYEQARVHEAHMRALRDTESSRTPAYDNSVNPRYAVGTRKYNSKTPGRYPS